MAGDFQAFHAVARLTNDPKRHGFADGGAVVNFGIAFTGNTRNNPQTGKREDEPCYLDCKAFINNQGRGIGDVFLRFTSKGARVFVCGRLVLDKWTDRDGRPQRAIRLVVERMTLLESRQDRGTDGGSGGTNSGSWDGGGDGYDDGGGYDGSAQGGNRQQSRSAAPSGGGWDDSAPQGGDDDQIPF